MPDWESATGVTCAQYEAKSWCTPSGGYGSGWKDGYGTFEKWGDENGVDATQACCECGGEAPTQPPVEPTPRCYEHLR